MDAGRTSSESPRWLGISLIWLGVGLFDATQTVFAMRSEGMHHAWLELFVMLLFSWLPWALATPLVIRLGRQFPPVRLRPASTWSVHVGAYLSVSLTSAAWIAFLELLLNPWGQSTLPGSFKEVLLSKFYSGLLSSMILYAFILAISNVLDSKERLALQQTETARLNEQLSKAQLNALRRQIEPHFLFNSLNAIAGLIREKRNDAAVSMIVALSDFLRRVLEDSNRHEVALEREVEFLRQYLEIQKLRFADRLALSVDIPPELYPAQVPSLILQPLVENAIKHGIAKRVQGGEIRISAARSNGTLHFTVYNDGPSLPDRWEEATSGIGISNLRTRLQSLYGIDFNVSLRNQGPNGVEVSVSMPFKEK